MKTFISTAIVLLLAANLIYAETPKQSKTTKANDVNKTMTDEEFMSQFMMLDKQEKDAKKLGKTLDEINKLLDNNKK